MARKRMIDPEYWTDEELGQWSFQARLFYIGLWNFADDEGRLKANSKLLKAQIFPYDDKIDVDKLKDEVSDKVQWYADSGQQYGNIRNFLKHQRIDRPTDSKLPEPPHISEDSMSPQRGVLPKLSKDKLSKDSKPLQAQLSDEEFIKKLKENPAYKGIDINKELGKMDAWFLIPANKNRNKNHKFIVNWLNKCDPPMQGGKEVKYS